MRAILDGYAGRAIAQGETEMAEFPALPIFTDAYLADTRHLTAAQHGAYLLLLMMAWRTPDCSLPDDDEKLARWSCMDKRTWKANKETILSFWARNNSGHLIQKRLLDERKYVEQLRSKNVRAGKISALKRLNRGSTTVQPEVNETSTPIPTPTPIEEKENYAKEKAGDENHAQADQRISPSHHQPDAGANPVTATAKPQPTYAGPEQLAGYQLAAANPQAIMDFEALYAIWPAKRKKPEAKQAYFRAINRGIKNETLMNGASRYNRKIEKKPPESENFISALHDWLDSDGWTSTFGAKPNRKPQV